MTLAIAYGNLLQKPQETGTRTKSLLVRYLLMWYTILERCKLLPEELRQEGWNFRHLLDTGRTTGMGTVTISDAVLLIIHYLLMADLETCEALTAAC